MRNEPGRASLAVPLPYLCRRTYWLLPRAAPWLAMAASYFLSRLLCLPGACCCDPCPSSLLHAPRPRPPPRKGARTHGAALPSCNDVIGVPRACAYC